MIHKKDLYWFIASQPSGFDNSTSAAASSVFSVFSVFSVGFCGLGLGAVPFFTRFLADTGVELDLLLRPAAGEFVLPLVAGDMTEIYTSWDLKGESAKQKMISKSRCEEDQDVGLRDLSKAEETMSVAVESIRISVWGSWKCNRKMDLQSKSKSCA